MIEVYGFQLADKAEVPCYHLGTQADRLNTLPQGLSKSIDVQLGRGSGKTG